MGQKITEYPQVDLWVKLTREADKAGAVLPSRTTSDVREMSKYAEMDRARHRSAFTVNFDFSRAKRQESEEESGNA